MGDDPGAAAPLAGAGDMDWARDGREDAPVLARGTMAQRAARRERGREPRRLSVESRMAHDVDADVHAMEPSVGHQAVEGAARDARGEELSAGHEPALARGERRDRSNLTSSPHTGD